MMLSLAAPCRKRPHPPSSKVSSSAPPAPSEMARAVEKMKEGPEGIKQPLEEALETTKSIGDQMEIIGTQLQGAFAPIATGLANSLKDAGATVTDWLKEHQAKIVSWATTIMHAVLATASFIVRTMGGVVEEAAPYIQAFARGIAIAAKLALAELTPIIKILDALHNTWGAEFLGPIGALSKALDTGSLVQSLNDAKGAADAVITAPIASTLAGIGNAGIGVADKIDQMTRSLDKLGAKGTEFGAFNTATLGGSKRARKTHAAVDAGTPPAQKPTAVRRRTARKSLRLLRASTSK